MPTSHEADVPGPRREPPRFARHRPLLSRGRQLRELAVHVGEGCGPDCAYCLIDSWEGRLVAPPRLEPAQAQELVHSMAQDYDAVQTVRFFGGEPLKNLPAIEAAADALRGLHRSGRLRALPTLRVVSPMSVATAQVLAFVDEQQLTVVGRIDGPDRTTGPVRGSFAAVDRIIRRMRTHTGQPSELEVFYGPKHANCGLSMVDVHRFLADRYGIPSIALYPLYPDPDCPHELTDVRERMFQHSADYHRFRSQQR